MVKGLAKKIPLLGLGLGAVFAAQRAMAGDFAGAAMELASGAASTVPGLGTAASVAIDAALIAKDVGVFYKKDKNITPPPPKTEISTLEDQKQAMEKEKITLHQHRQSLRHDTTPNNSM